MRFMRVKLGALITGAAIASGTIIAGPFAYAVEPAALHDNGNNAGRGQDTKNIGSTGAPSPANAEGPGQSSGSAERIIPVQRELSDEDYHWLGRVVWQAMQEKVPPEQRRGLNSREIHALVEAMLKNRNEFNVQLSDLMRILNTRAKQRKEAAADPAQICPEQPVKGQVFGFDLDRLRPPQH